MNINKNLFLSTFLAASLCIAPTFSVFSALPASGNGNTTADAPEPTAVKKTVRKARVKKPVKKNTAKAKQTAAKKTVTKRPVITSLERGIALMNQERYELARPWLQKAIQENRLSAAAWYWYGMYHEKTGKFYEAQYFYTKAVKADPTFEPLSRVVSYPDDPNKTAVWDSRRPARVYDIHTSTKNGTVIPPNSPQANRLPKRTDAANNPELPRVPVYTPPEPGSMPADGDAWRPSVYVPPNSSSAQNGNAVYLPPSHSEQGNPIPVQIANDLEILDAEQNTTPQPVYNPPLPVMPESEKQQAAYQPPAPDKKVAVSSNSAKKVVKPDKDKKRTAAKNKKAEKPLKNNKNNKNNKKPAQKTQTARPERPAQPKTDNNNKAGARPENQQQNQQRPRITELPPVGQSMNNNNLEAPLPPVGQK